MKILLIANSDFGVRNTIGARVLPIAEALEQNGHDVKIFTRDHRRKDNSQKISKVIPCGRIIMKALTGLRVYVSTSLSSKTNLVKNWLFDYFMLKKLKRLDLGSVDIIHSWDFLPKSYAFLKRNHPKIRLVQDVAIAFPNVIRNIEEKDLWNRSDAELQKWVKESWEHVDHYLVPSEFVGDSLKAEGIPDTMISLVPFGVDSEQFRPRDHSGEKLKFAFVGNISHRKGIKYLIHAWAELNIDNIELNLYGRVFPEVKNLISETATYNINIHGIVDPTVELPKNDIYVFPSLMEGSSKSVYEAMACGLPVITTYNSGSVVEDGKEGFIIPVQDVEAIKEKILFFYNNPDKIKEFGKRARKKAEKYTWERYAKEVKAIYRTQVFNTEANPNEKE